MTDPLTAVLRGKAPTNAVGWDAMVEHLRTYGSATLDELVEAAARFIAPRTVHNLLPAARRRELLDVWWDLDEGTWRYRLAKHVEPWQLDPWLDPPPAPRLVRPLGAGRGRR